MTVDELIRDYDLGTRELVTEASSDRTDEKLSWRAVYVAGEYSVGCDVKGRLYSFETDMINVTPVSDAARIIFDLREAPGESYSEKRERAEKDEEVLSTAIDLYAVDNGRPPSTEQSFEALVEKPTVEPVPRNWYGPYLRSSGTPLDPWGSPYRYEYELRSGKDHYTITSYGTDGGPGGEGEARDIVLQDDTN